MVSVLKISSALHVIGQTAPDQKEALVVRFINDGRELCYGFGSIADFLHAIDSVSGPCPSERPKHDNSTIIFSARDTFVDVVSVAEGGDAPLVISCHGAAYLRYTLTPSSFFWAIERFRVPHGTPRLRPVPEVPDVVSRIIEQHPPTTSEDDTWTLESIASGAVEVEVEMLGVVLTAVSDRLRLLTGEVEDVARDTAHQLDDLSTRLHALGVEAKTCQSR